MLGISSLVDLIQSPPGQVGVAAGGYRDRGRLAARELRI